MGTDTNYTSVTTKYNVVVVVLGFYVPPTTKVIRRRDLRLKSHPKDCKYNVPTIIKLLAISW